MKKNEIYFFSFIRLRYITTHGTRFNPKQPLIATHLFTTTTTTTNMSNIDEYGRDRSLRIQFKELHKPHKVFQNITDEFRNMSWADICECVEEKEKLQQIKELRQKLQITYELEEGEVPDE